MPQKTALKILIEILIFGVLLTALGYFFFSGNSEGAVLLIPLILFQLYRVFRIQNKIYTEFSAFVDSIRYKDFSRHFNTRKAPAEMIPFRKGFNELYEIFRETGKEKEMQYQYLQKILEMVNTGILSYEFDTGEVMWLNQSLKQILQVPYLKTIDSLEKRHKELYEDIIRLSPGDSKISNLYFGSETYKILLTETAFRTDDKKYILVGVQNISNAVDETESEAWRKLLRVMTHEIMNSVAPISSLASTLQQTISDQELKAKYPESSAFEDLRIGVNTIKNRSESLLKFAETYRSLNKITTPDVKSFHVLDLFENISNLMEPTLEKKGIELEIVLKDPALEMEADRTLIEQVMINLVLNAMEAVKETAEKRITLSAEETAKKIAIKVSDTGVGMDKEVMEKIFIPFFTTRKNGSGIGLSLSRQIMRAHKGNLHVVSEPGKGTAFILQF